MKKTLLLFALFISFIFNGLSQNYYYGPEGKVFLELSTKKILVKFADGIKFEQQRQLLSEEKLLIPIDEAQLLPKPTLTLIELTENVEEKDLQPLLKRLNSLDEVLYANHFLLHEDETLHGIMDEIIVKIEKEEDLGPMRFLLEKYATAVVKENKFVPLQYHLKVDQDFELNALQVANALFETGLFEFAEPNFLRIMKRMSTSDPFVDNQWSLQNDGVNTSQYNGVAGSDMKVFQAWESTTGSPAIKVAILDEGVDLVHPDLVGNMLLGFDATEQGSGGAPSNNDAHGTACAGIVAAVANNDIGVAGVAYNSKIIPVRIAYDPGSGWVTSNEWIGNAINWSWQTAQADVLSNSWGGGGSSSVINNAIDGAVNSGRGGLGAPVLFAAGNGNGAVSYPASYEPAIAVVAMSMCEERKSPSSCDGETWWGSDFGTGADVAAPGVKIYTTDISGSAGYTDGDYTSSFNGTSSACPNAAGVMALVLSLDPSLSEANARTILESSCDKVGGYTYTDNVTGQPSGTWSQELGYGRVNAAKALELIDCDECLLCFDGIQNGQETGVDCGGPTCSACPTCDDGIQNGQETGIDCGGPDCSECPPTCSDGIQNGDEEGVDCGGSNCPECPATCDDGKQNGDEEGVDCGGSNCIPCPTCTDNIKNGDEEGVDCGGPDCVSCNGCFDQQDFSDFNEDFGIWIDGGSDCRRSSSDAEFSVNGTGACVRLRDNSSSSVVTSSNMNLSGFNRVNIRFSYITLSFDNADEDFWLQVSTDGGSTFTTVEEWNLGDEFENEVRYFESVDITGPFSSNTQFRFRADASDNGDYVYIDEVRITACDGEPAEPTCDDGIQNGQETGVDCGGPDCPACPTEPTCDDGIQNGQETGVDCGGPDCPACPTEPTCDDGIQNGQETGVDCGGPDCPACPTEPTCDDGIQNGQETGVDCGGPDCPACPVEPTCDDGIQNGQETGVDCGGPDCPACPVEPTCNDGIQNGQETGIDCGGPDCVPCSTDCTVQEIDFNDFNSSYGIWNDGGSDCTRSTGDAQYAVGGVGAPVRLRDNSSSSVVTTDNLSLVTYQEITVNFSYLARSMDNPDEDFWLQISTDGGATFTTVEEWNLGDEFENDIRYFDAVTISGPFSNTTQIRFRCDASSNTDYVYLDDIRITGCNSVPSDPTCTDGIQNGQETGVDCGGPDCPDCPTCTDGVQNGQETGVDCGGPDCPACPTEPSCTDGIQNGQETGVDCGGPDCPTCPTCDDGILNGDETGVDCGGPDCAPCSGECTTQLINFNDFNATYGIWNDGGSDCSRSTAYPQYAAGGTGAVVRLRDNSSSSVLTTDNLNLSPYQELTIDFTYVASSMDNPDEDFFLEISTDGGASFTLVEEWNLGDEFENELRYFEAITIPGPFTANTQLRFRCDASSNTDYVYIDDVSISGCVNGAALTVPSTNRGQMSTIEHVVEDIILLPNPVRDLLQVNFTLTVEEEVNMIVRNLQGQIMSQSLLQGQLGINQQEINVQSLPAGIYILQLSSKSGNRSERFIVSN